MSLDFKGPVDTDMPNDPYGTPVLSGCPLAAYVPLRFIRSESVS